MKNLLYTIVLLVLLSLTLTGCNRVDLYTDLDVQDANEIQAILLRQGIDCDKTPGKEGAWGLQVNKNQMASAVEILKGNGYPKEKFADMGTLFKKEGLVSSPQQDRIRYIYALSQEMSATLSKIDGVVNAKVHIVLPENDPLSEYFQPSSASVFIKYNETVNVTQLIHPVKQLVVNSIEGLNYEKVSVVSFPTPVVTAAQRNFARVMGIEINAAYAGRFKLLVYGLIFFLTILMAAGVYQLWHRMAPKQAVVRRPGREKERGNVIAI